MMGHCMEQIQKLKFEKKPNLKHFLQMNPQSLEIERILRLTKFFEETTIPVKVLSFFKSVVDFTWFTSTFY